MAKQIISRISISGPDISETIELKPGSNSIGRQSGNDIRVPSPLISRQHAIIQCADAECAITDMGSANGTVVNGEALPANTPRPLISGDTITLGPFELVFEQLVFDVEPEPPPKPKAKPKPKPKPEPEPEPEPAPAPPAPPAPPPLAANGHKPEPDYSKPPPGLRRDHSRYLNYLPGIYHSDFMTRFLALFEAVLTPIEWNVDNFDVYLDPRTAPAEFLPWLATWFAISFDATWSEEQRRQLLMEAHQLFARRGTRWSLSRLLEIYTGEAPEIDDSPNKDKPFTFTVKIPLTEAEVDRRLIERMIDASKPAHTSYELEFKKNGRSRSRKK